MIKIDRLIGTILLLQSKKFILANEIAEYFSVSVRTVYRDIQTLDEAGVPIVYTHGEGYSLMEGYNVPPLMFTAEEVSGLFLGGKFALKVTDASIHKPIISALAKIRSVLPEKTKDYIEKLSSSIHLAFGFNVEKKYENKVQSDIQEALATSKLLEIEYYTQSRDSLSKRIVEPVGLVYYGNSWHLIAYCRMRKDFRDFRLDRIKTLFVSSDRFKRRENFNISELVNHWREFEKTNAIEIKFIVQNPEIAQEIRLRYRNGYLCDEKTENGFVFTYLVPDTDLVKFLFVSYGAKVKIISPENVRIELLESVKEILKLYS
ncbi:YafY family transcriptional regulator [bacterium]|nr:YafY family transcriptional regulator [bacterium]